MDQVSKVKNINDLNLKRIKDPSDLVIGQTYKVKAGFAFRIIVYDGSNLPNNFKYALNTGFGCEWEDNQLLNNIMVVVSQFHQDIIEKRYKTLSEIIKDGSIFMNKVKFCSDKLCLSSGANVDSVIQTLRDYYEMANHLSDNSIKYLSFDWCFYRSAGKTSSNCLEKHKNTIMPLPFSVTSSITVAKNWMSTYEDGSTCCLYKILVPGDTPFACLESFYERETLYSPNLYEGETMLPSGVLNLIKTETLEFEDSGGNDVSGKVKFYTCQFIPYTEQQAIDKIKLLKKQPPSECRPV